MNLVNNAILKWRILQVYLYFTLILFTLTLESGCKKLTDTPTPTDQIAENAVYSNNATAISALSAIYSSMNTAPFQGSLAAGSISLFAGLAADEYTLADGVTSNTYLNYYQNNLSQTPPNVGGAEHWALLYNLIFKANAALQGLSSSNADGLNLFVKQQLIGEAKFLRAFFYFYLVNEFGDVPLALTTDPKTNTQLTRSPKAKVYEQIIEDLIDAQNQLSENFLDITLLNTTNERVRPTKWAATALLARIYLYTENFTKAEEQSNLVINNTTLFGPLSSVQLNDVFLKNSREAIWQIQPTDIDYNTQEGYTLIIPSTGPSASGTTNPIFLSDRLLNSFEPGDQRAVLGNWVNRMIYNITPTEEDTVFYPFKYKVSTSTGVSTISGLQEYFMVLRLAEQYLIRAEARAHLQNVNGAQSDLNEIRTRAGLPNTTATDEASLLTAILHERQVELFSEWGQRWFDLKRTKKIDELMLIVTPEKANGAPWRSYQQRFPLPLESIRNSPNLDQNEGY